MSDLRQKSLNSLEGYMVSIRLMTFNHENYIRDAIHGILIQNTNFKVEVVVGDDFSTDKTLEIIKSYKNTENIEFKILKRSKGDGYWEKRQKLGRLFNFVNILENCSGKYIAILDGDDYWIDPLKLQKQVDFLENSAGFGLVHTDSHILHESIDQIEESINRRYKIEIPEGNIFDDLLIRNTIKTLTVVFQRKLLKGIEDELNIYQFNCGDYPLWLWLSKKCKIGYIPRSTTVYRKQLNSEGNSTDHKKLYELKKGIFRIKKYFIDNYGCYESTKKEVEKEFFKMNFNFSYIFKDYFQSKNYFDKMGDDEKNKFENKLKLIGTRNNLTWEVINLYLRVTKKLKSNFQ